MKESSIVRRKSKIEGQGVFAIENIRKGTRIVEYQGERKPFKLFEADSENYVNLFHVGRGLVIDPTRGGNIARFINHSCAPNCESIDDGGRIYIEAIRSIKKGEELTYDYHLDVGGAPTSADRKRYACRCDSTHCRGTMYDAKKTRKAKKTGKRKV